MTKKTVENKADAVKFAVIGASVAALAATTYFFFGPKGKKHQKQARAWAIKMKGDVVEKLEKAAVISEVNYKEIVDSVAKRYQREKRAGQQEIKALANDLKKHWGTIGKRAQAVKRDTVKGVKKITSKK